MLFTRKGDGGKTKIFDCDQSFSKSSAVAEALGALDEANSYLGICKGALAKGDLQIGGVKMNDIIHQAQKDLFVVQAQVAGAMKDFDDSKVPWLESIVAEVEEQLPPIKSFFVSGASEIGADLDFARTLVRRAERRVVAVSEEGKAKISKNVLAYCNRLSSLLYALARYSNYKSGAVEDTPDYK